MEKGQPEDITTAWAKAGRFNSPIPMLLRTLKASSHSYLYLAEHCHRCFKELICFHITGHDIDIDTDMLKKKAGIQPPLELTQRHYASSTSQKRFPSDPVLFFPPKCSAADSPNSRELLEPKQTLESPGLLLYAVTSQQLAPDLNKATVLEGSF